MIRYEEELTMNATIKVISHSQYGTEDRFAVDLVEQLPALHRGALRLTRHEADAQDLVQDTLTRALERRAQFQPGTNLRAWLFTVQRSLFINAYRRRRQVAWLGSLEDENQDGTEVALTRSSAEETMLEGWVDEDLRAALAALPEQYREVVVLRDVAQRSYAQIAVQLDCPPGTVMSRLHRGRALLRQLLKPAGGGPFTLQPVVRTYATTLLGERAGAAGRVGAADGVGQGRRAAQPGAPARATAAGRTPRDGLSFASDKAKEARQPLRRIGTATVKEDRLMASGTLRHEPGRDVA
jgi:RNA polymerase sigma-70 factor (ECF subfamily)